MNGIIHISSIEEIVDLLLKYNHLVIEHGWFDDRFHFMTLDLQRDFEIDSNAILFQVQGEGEDYGFEWYLEGIVKNIIDWMSDATKIHLITDDNQRYSIGDRFRTNFNQRMKCYINGVIRDIITSKLIASK